MSSDDIGDQRPTNALRSGSVDAKAAVSHVDDEGRIPALPGKSGTERDVHGDSLLVRGLPWCFAIRVSVLLPHLSLTRSEQTGERSRRSPPAA